MTIDDFKSCFENDNRAVKYINRILVYGEDDWGVKDIESTHDYIWDRYFWDNFTKYPLGDIYFTSLYNATEKERAGIPFETIKEIINLLKEDEI